MKNIYLEVSPYLPNGTLTTLRMCSSGVGPATTTQNGYTWLPFIVEYPTFDANLVNGGLLAESEFSYGQISFNVSEIFGNEIWSTYDFTGALARLWWGEADADFSTYKQIFEGAVSALSREEFIASMSLLGTEADIATELLYDAYAGTGGAEGPPTLKGTLKPWLSGFCENISPVLVDPVFWVYQVHGYGPVNDIVAVYEFAQLLSDPVDTVDTYAELIALDLKEAEWAKAPAIGMFRLGGQPSQKLTCDVEGALDGADYPNTVSDIARHLIKTISPTASFGDLSAFEETNWCYYTTSQVVLGDVVRQALYQAGGFLLPDGMGVWHVGDFFNPKPQGTLSTERDDVPLILSIKELTSGGPIYKVRVGHSRCWSTHSDSEISPALLELGSQQDALFEDAEAAREAAEQAAADLLIARERLEAMSADNVLDRAEKKYLAREFATLAAERLRIQGEATAFPEVATQLAAYLQSFTDLAAYLAGLDPAFDDTENDTTIDRAEFQSAWMAVYETKALLLAALATAASKTAEWDLVTDPNGTKPEDNATVGAPPGTPIGDRPVEDVLSDIDFLLANDGRAPPSVLAPILEERIQRIETSTILGVTANDKYTRIAESNIIEKVRVEEVARLDLEAAMNHKFDLELVARDELQLQIDDNSAAISNEQAARVGENAAMATDITNLTARVGSSESEISNVKITVSTNQSALASEITTLKSRVSTAEADIYTEQTTRANADTAQASSITSLTSRVGTAESNITNEVNTRTTQYGTLNTSVTNMTSRFNNFNGVTSQTVEAAYNTERTTRANADSGLATDISYLSTRMGNAESAIINEASTRSNADSANASSINTLTTRLNNSASTGQTVEARIQGAYTAVSNESSARATAITNVQTNFNGQIATVSNNLSSTNTAVSGIQNRWSVTMDANGKVAGVGLMNGTNQVSEFGVRADRFVFYNASGVGTAPFFISGNQTYIQNAVIQNLSIGTEKLPYGAITAPQTYEFGDFSVTANITQSQSGGGYTFVGAGNGDYTMVVSNFYYSYVGPGQGNYIYVEPTYTITGGQTIFETGWINVGTGSLYGGIMAVMYATYFTSENDAGQLLVLQTDINNGAGFAESKITPVGMVTSNGNTRGAMPFAMTTTVPNIQNARFKLITGRHVVTSGGILKNSSLQNVTLSVMGTKR